MRVLLIGSTSLLGKALAVRLENRGDEVRFAGRSGSLQLELGLGEPPEWAVRERFDAVVNLAGALSPESAGSDRDMMLVNSFGPLFAAQLAEAVGATRLVHISTCYVTDPAGYRGHPLYPLTKRHGDELLAARIPQSPLTVTVLRPSHVYDDEGRCRPSQLGLYRLVDGALAGVETPVPEPGLSRDYLHIDDFCTAVLVALELDAGGVFDIVSPGSRSFEELARAAHELVEGRPASEMNDEESAVSTLPGFRSVVSIEMGLSRIIEAARA